MGYPESQNDMKILKRNTTFSYTDFGLVAATFIAALAGWNSFWTESEIWNTVVVKHLFHGLVYYDFSLKPFFNLLLFCNFQVASFLGIHPMDSARAIFAFNGMLMVFLVQRIARTLGASVILTLLVCLLCVGNSFVIKRFFSVRSDMLITTLFLALTWWALLPRWKLYSTRVRLAIFTVFALIGVGITPKAVAVVVAWGYAFLFPSLPGKKARYGIAAAIAGLFVVGLGLLQPKSLNFFVQSFSVHSAGLEYWHPQRLEHLLRFLKENPLIVLTGGLGLYAQFARALGLSANSRAVITFANLQWLAMLVYPERLPFYIASLVPYFVLVIPAAWKKLMAREPFKPLSQPRVAWGVGVFCVLALVYWSAFLLVRHHHRDQKTYIAWLESKSDQLKNLRIYDPVGVLPYLDAWYWFVGPNEAGNKDVLRDLKSQEMDVIIGSNKIFMFGPEFVDWLRENYWTSGDGIFIRKTEIAVPSGTITNTELVLLLGKPLSSLVNNPTQEFSIRVITKEGLDLTRYAYWLNEKGEKLELANALSFDRLYSRRDSILHLPKGTRLLILPVMLQTPFDPQWIELFRFDPEY